MERFLQTDPSAPATTWRGKLRFHLRPDTLNRDYEGQASYKGQAV